MGRRRLSEPEPPPTGRTGMFERVTAALGFVLVAAGAAALGLLQGRTPDPPQTPAEISDKDWSDKDWSGKDWSGKAWPGHRWRRVVMRTWSKFNRRQIHRVAAGVAFFALLSMFPAMAAFVSLYGLFADAEQAPHHLAILAGVMPRAALSLAANEMTRLSAGRHPALGFAFVVSVIASLWSANGAVKALLAGLNTAYEARERRGLIRLNLVSLAFTVAGLAFVMTAFGLVVAGPPVLRALGWKGRLDPSVVGVLRWPVLFVGSACGLAMLYRFGPSRHRGRWRWVTAGSALASLAWLAMSMGFSRYVSNFGHYERTYGSLGAVVGFMIWLWLSAIVVLAGAELNAEIEAEAAARSGRRDRD